MPKALGPLSCVAKLRNMTSDRHQDEYERQYRTDTHAHYDQMDFIAGRCGFDIVGKMLQSK